MAVFLINICKFNGCGITFPSLGDLIQHIEETHISYDPKVIQEKEKLQPTSLPLSYVLRFITDAARKESPFISSQGNDVKRKMTIKHHSYSMSSSNRSNTPTGSEMDEEEMMISESEDSNESWTTEEFSSAFIMRYGSRHSGNTGNGTNEKPFACPVPGCKKRYKNVNGIKYHSKNGHKKDGKVRKGFKCECGKSYKTSQGLKNHKLNAHNVVVTNGVGTVTNGNVSVDSMNLGGNTTIFQSNGSPTTVNTNGVGISMSSSSSSNSSHSGSISPTTSLNGTVKEVTASMSSSSPPSPLPINQTTTLTTMPNTIGKSSFGLITIKTKSGNLNNAIQTITSAGGGAACALANNKIVKIINAESNGGDGKTKMCESLTLINPQPQQQQQQVKMSLPNLVNLGIITTNSSPKLIQQHQQQQQSQVIHSGVSNVSNNVIKNGNTDLMPLTPISPNLCNGINFAGSNNSSISSDQIISEDS